MKKIILLLFVTCLAFNGCGYQKVYTKHFVENQRKSFSNPLIVITSNDVTKFTSEKLKNELFTLLFNNNLNFNIHILEIKKDELVLNEKKQTLFEEIAPIYKKNNNDVVILFKYEDFHYGAYGDSFIQQVFVLDNEQTDDNKKIVWYSKGYSNFDGIKKYCTEIVNKLIENKIISNY